MEPKAHFKDFFEYSNAMSLRLLDALPMEAEVPERAQAWVDHILNAHHIWNQRILGDKSEFGVWERHSEEKGKVLPPI